MTEIQKQKKREYSKRYYQENKFKWFSIPTELRSKRHKEWLDKNPEYKKTHSSNMFRNKQLEKLAGRPKSATCEICGDGNSKICFDHDHATGKFRGWLCLHCNSTLGYARDNPEVLQKLIDYLNFHKMFKNVEQVPISAGVA